MGSPFGKYCQAGHKVDPWLFKRDTSHHDKLIELEKASAAGLCVARTMLSMRWRWLETELQLAQGTYSQAVALFAESLSASHADGDPFLGWWNPTRMESHIMQAAEHVLCQGRDRESGDTDGAGQHVRNTRTCATVDAHFLLAYAQMAETRFSTAVVTIMHAVTACPTDSRPITLRCILYGNLGRWVDSLDDVNRCIQLEPQHPMHAFLLAGYLLAAPTQCRFGQHDCRLQAFSGAGLA